MFEASGFYVLVLSNVSCLEGGYMIMMDHDDHDGSI